MSVLSLSKYNDIEISTPISGSCQCGSVKYSSSAKPIIAFHCQCKHCQKFSSTGHGSYVLLSKIHTAVTGDVSLWSYKADSGNLTTKNFCPKCGTQVFSLTSGHPNNFIANAMTLDNPKLFLPSLVLFENSSQSWDLIDSSLKRFSSGA